MALKTLTLRELIEFLNQYAAKHPEHADFPVYASYDGGFEVKIGRVMELDEYDQSSLLLGGG